MNTFLYIHETVILNILSQEKNNVWKTTEQEELFL